MTKAVPLVWFIAMMGGCGELIAPAKSSLQSLMFTDDEEECELDYGESEDDEACDTLAAAVGYDDFDNGADVFDPGCHGYHNETGAPPTCMGDHLWFKVLGTRRKVNDYCVDPNNDHNAVAKSSDIMEMTISACHTNAANGHSKPGAGGSCAQKFDCTTKCRDKHGDEGPLGPWFGECINMPEHCVDSLGTVYDSAKCICWQDPTVPVEETAETGTETGIPPVAE